MFVECIMAQKLFTILTKIVKIAMDHKIEQSPANLIFLQGKLPSSKDEKTALIDLHVFTLHTLQKLALSE